MKKVSTLISRKKEIIVIVLAIVAFAALVTITAIYMVNHPSVLG